MYIYFAFITNKIKLIEKRLADYTVHKSFFLKPKKFKLFFNLSF